MARTKRTKSSSVGNIESRSNNRILSSSNYSSYDDCDLIAVIYVSIPPPNAPKKTTLVAISISEHSKNYSKHNSENIAHIVRKPSQHQPPIE